jgi:hypothetical protein
LHHLKMILLLIKKVFRCRSRIILVAYKSNLNV